MTDDLCRGCTSKTGMNYKCTLEPKYKNRTCPCATCIVKVICSKDSRSCKKYKRFCTPQVKHYLIPRVMPPCKECDDYNKCLITLDEMAHIYIGNENCHYTLDDIYLFLEENSGDLFFQFLLETEKSCDKLKEYFPVEESKDSIMIWPPEWRNVNFSIIVWNYREHRLMDLFNTEKVLNKILHKIQNERNIKSDRS